MLRARGRFVAALAERVSELKVGDLKPGWRDSVIPRAFCEINLADIDWVILPCPPHPLLNALWVKLR